MIIFDTMTANKSKRINAIGVHQNTYHFYPVNPDTFGDNQASKVVSGKTFLLNCFGFKIVFLFFFLLFGKGGASQNKLTNDLNLMLNFHSGYNLPEYAFISSLTEDYIRSWDISLFKETSGKSEWDQLYNYPEYGMSFFYSSLGNDRVLGKEWALNYFVKMYLFSKQRFRLYNRIGTGISYVSRKFHLKDNYLNVAVGSHLNIHFNYRLGATYALSDKLKLNSGLSFDHFSNANTSEPNLGINYVTFYGGLSLGLGNKSQRQKHELKSHIKENRVVLFASMGGKHPRALTSSYLKTSSISLEFSHAYARLFHVGIGSDLFYDSSVKSSLEKAGERFENYYSFQTGLHLTQSLVFKKFSFSIQEGVYLFLTERIQGFKIYNRLLVQYTVTDHLLIRFAMKSHLHILDFPELGLGYKF